MGGPDHRSPLVPVQDDPAVRTLRAVANARRTLRAGFTTVRNLGLFVQTGGLLLDVALKKAIDLGWIDGPRVVPGGPRHHADRWSPRPDHVPGLRAPHHAAHRRGGNRRRGRAGAQGRPLPDQARGPGHQGLRLGWRDVAHGPGRRPAVLRRRAPGHRRRGAPGRTAGGGPRPRRRRDTGRHRGRRRLHRARVAHERRHPRPADREGPVPRGHHLPGRRHGHLPRRPGAAGQGGRGLPPGQGDHLQGHRPWGADRLRHRRSRPSPTAATPRSSSPWWTGA